MATPCSEIINAFILKVKAYKLMSIFDDEEREEIVMAFLKSAISKFYLKCHKPLNINEDMNFDVELSIDEVDILAELMVVEWLTPQMYDDELLESRLNTKDFTEFSPAKLIEQIHNVYNSSKKRAKYMMIEYTYNHGNVRDLDDE